MKKTFIILILICLAIAIALLSSQYFKDSNPNLKNEISEGDIIFQTDQSGQSKAIQLATHSKYSHCGIIFKDNEEYYVYEGVQPVKRTPLYKFIARGEDRHYEIKGINPKVELWKL